MTEQKNKFVMYGPHIIQASTIDRVICEPHFDNSSKELSYICTVHTNTDKYQKVSFISKYDAINANAILMKELNKFHQFHIPQFGDF